MPKMIGDPAAVHIHDEGRRTHYKYGTSQSTRHNFSTDDEEQMQAALDKLKTEGWSKKSGYDACIKWFKKLRYT